MGFYPIRSLVYLYSGGCRDNPGTLVPRPFAGKALRRRKARWYSVKKAVLFERFVTISLCLPSSLHSLVGDGAPSYGF